jgi:hypothetical protein
VRQSARDHFLSAARKPLLHQRGELKRHGMGVGSTAATLKGDGTMP